MLKTLFRPALLNLALALLGAGSAAAFAIAEPALPAPAVSLDSQVNGLAHPFPGLGSEVSGSRILNALPVPAMDAPGSPAIREAAFDAAIHVGTLAVPGRIFRLEYPGTSDDPGIASSGPEARPSGEILNSLDPQPWIERTGNIVAPVDGNARMAAHSVPEPTSLVLLGVGLLGMAYMSGRKRGHTAKAHHHTTVVGPRASSGM